MTCNLYFKKYNSYVDSPTGRKGRNLTALPHLVDKVKHEKVVFMIKKVCPFCGKEFMSSRSISSNRDKYCSKECSIKAQIIDLTGQKFGRLKVIKYAGSKDGALWLCQCDCGNEKIISSRNLLKGVTKSCGCYSKEYPAHTIHGLYYTRLHNIWNSMKNRCYNKNDKRYPTYGGRGIKICDEWKNDFKIFYDWAIANGYNENAKRGVYTIDRINNDKDYEPNNCRLVDNKTQNRKRTNTRYVIYKGKEYCIGELAEMLNVNYYSLWGKLKRNNWDTSCLQKFKRAGEN